MKRITLVVPIALGALLAMCSTTPPRVVEVPEISSPTPQPQPEEAKVVQHGKASFYADSFHGKQTASGAPMDQNALTAASKELPLGTVATVTNLATGDSVQVEVNDRGPFVPGRVIDLSKRAAEAIELKHQSGVAAVKVEAKPEDQPTPELKSKVAKIAAAKQAAAKRRLAQQAARKKVPAKPPAPQDAAEVSQGN